MATKHEVDPFVTAVERALDADRPAESDDPVVQRERAAAFDLVSSGRLGITPIESATEESTLPVDGHPAVRVRVYWPTPERAEPGADLPMLVYCYGGGFTLAGIDWPGWDAMFRLRARDAGIIVVAVDYAHAPEVRFPAQPEQCWTALEWAHEHAASLGGDPDRMAIGGASSGGNLAAAVALMNRDRSGIPLRLQLLESPALDLTMGHVDADGLSTSVPGIIVRKVGRRLTRQYLGDDRALARQPYASPLLADSLAGLPPAAIYTAELDTLRGDGESYARALAAAGVPATAVRYIAQTHTSSGLRGHVPAADHQHRDVVQTLRTLHEPARVYGAPV